MNIDYLHEFVVLTETLSYQEAAEHLFLSQSTLSKHIQALEKELGHTLFSRTTRKVTLSESGELFLPYARQIARLQSEYTAVLKQAQQDHKFLLKLGSIPLMAQYQISSRLAEFKKLHQDISLQITENDSKDLIPLLRRGQCELAFLRLDSQFFPPPDYIDHFPVTTDQLCALVHKDHPLGAQTCIRLSQLAGEEFLLFQENSQMNGFSRYACGKEGFKPKVSFNGRRPENLADLAAHGLGTALLMKKHTHGLSLEGVRLLDIEPAYTNTIELCCRKDHPLSPAAKAFIRFMNCT